MRMYPARPAPHTLVSLSSVRQTGTLSPTYLARNAYTSTRKYTCMHAINQYANARMATQNNKRPAARSVSQTHQGSSQYHWVAYMHVH